MGNETFYGDGLRLKEGHLRFLKLKKRETF